MIEVLLVEDDGAVRAAMTLALRRLGYAVVAVESGEDALAAVSRHEPDAIVLDLMLPGIDGFETIRRLRMSHRTPVLMVSARGDDFDVVGGLEAGADDYVVKPVEPRVLDARIRAVLRRAAPTAAPVEVWSELTIDRAALVVSRTGTKVDLAPTEMRLLLALSASPGQVLSRQQLLELVWEQDYLGDSRIVDACVQRLRAKLEADPSNPRYVQTVRGFGYRFGPV